MTPLWKFTHNSKIMQNLNPKQKLYSAIQTLKSKKQQNVAKYKYVDRYSNTEIKKLLNMSTWELRLILKTIKIKLQNFYLEQNPWLSTKQ